MKTLDPRRAEIKGLLDEGVTQKEIARRFGVTQGRISALKQDIALKLSAVKPPGEFLSTRSRTIVCKFAPVDDFDAVHAALPEIRTQYPTAKASLKEIEAWITKSRQNAAK